MVDRLCRTCALYDVAAVKDKAGRVRRGSMARCGWKMPEITYPASIPDYLRPQAEGTWMEPYDGFDCACWIEAKPHA